MNAALTPPARWRARRWIYTIAATFVLQAGLLFFLGRYDPPVAARPNFRTTVHLVSDPWSSEQLARLPAFTEPTLFALPAERGFSGAAWLRAQPFNYSPARWSEPPRWLALNQDSLGGGFAEFVATNIITPLLVADQPVPLLSRYEPGLGPEPSPASSRLRLEGSLAARGLLAPLELRSWPHTELLSNTTVQVAISVEGYILSARLLGESGLREADLRALDLAQSARFRPLPAAARDRAGQGPVEWGRMIFRWRTLPPNVTNSPGLQP